MRVVLKRSKLREWQEMKRLSNRQLASLLGISHSTVNLVLSGQRQPGSKFISAVLDRTDCPFESFFGVAL